MQLIRLIIDLIASDLTAKLTTYCHWKMLISHLLLKLVTFLVQVIKTADKSKADSLQERGL